MEYPKPTVTITIDEYNDLQKKRQLLEDKIFDELVKLEPYKRTIEFLYAKFLKADPLAHLSLIELHNNGIDVKMLRKLEGGYDVYCELIEKP